MGFRHPCPSRKNNWHRMFILPSMVRWTMINTPIPVHEILFGKQTSRCVIIYYIRISSYSPKSTRKVNVSLSTRQPSSISYIYDVITCHVISWYVYVIFYRMMQYHIMSYHTILCHFILCHIILYHILYYIISYYTISYHIMSFYIPSEEAIFLVVKSPFFQHKSPPLRGSTCHPSSAKWG